jgi:hypothetical protein
MENHRLRVATLRGWLAALDDSQLAHPGGSVMQRFATEIPLSPNLDFPRKSFTIFRAHDS